MLFLYFNVPSRWCSHTTTLSKLVGYPLGINRLIDLPADYIDLISLTSNA